MADVERIPLDDIRPSPGNAKRASVHHMTSQLIPCPGCDYVAHSRSALGGHVTRRHYDQRTLLLLDAYTEVRGHDECWPWKGTRSKNGYGVIVIDRRQHRVPRLVLGLRDDDHHQACHRCDNPPCVNPRHLFRATAAENQHDKRRKGRAARGLIPGGGRKLTADAVREIRTADAPVREVAERHGVSTVTVRNVLARRTWRHVR